MVGSAALELPCCLKVELHDSELSFGASGPLLTATRSWLASYLKAGQSTLGAASPPSGALEAPGRATTGRWRHLAIDVLDRAADARQGREQGLQLPVADRRQRRGRGLHDLG